VVQEVQTENFHFFEAQKSNNYLLSKNNGLNFNVYLEYEAPFLKGLKAKVTYNRNLENTGVKNLVQNTSCITSDVGNQ
jgi:hypothetical protein